MAMAPACTVTVSVPISTMRFILDILIRVPPSATPTGEVEWLEPTARTGEGYWSGSIRILTMSLTEVASTTTRGCETRSPNQLVIVVPAAIAQPSSLKPWGQLDNEGSGEFQIGRASCRERGNI